MAKIMVVDDETNIRDELSFILTKEGHTVTAFEDGSHCLDFFEKEPQVQTDLMIVDIMMPGLSGTDLIHRLGGENRLSGIPVLFLSALGQDEDILGAHGSAQEALTVDYLRKPFQTGWMLCRIHNLVALKYSMDELKRANEEISYTNLEITKLLSTAKTKTDYLEKLTQVLNRENTEVQKQIRTVREFFQKIAINDLPLLKFVSYILERNEKFIRETVTGGSEEGELFKVLSRTTEPLKTVAADLQQVLQLLIMAGLLKKESLTSVQVQKTSFYEILQKIYEKGGFSPELFQQFLGFATLDLDEGDVELF